MNLTSDLFEKIFEKGPLTLAETVKTKLDAKSMQIQNDMQQKQLKAEKRKSYNQSQVFAGLYSC